MHGLFWRKKIKCILFPKLFPLDEEKPIFLFTALGEI